MQRDDAAGRLSLRIPREVKARIEDTARERHCSLHEVVLLALGEFWQDPQAVGDPAACPKCGQRLPLDQRGPCVCKVSELRGSTATHCAVCRGYVPFDKRGKARLARDSSPGRPMPWEVPDLPPELRKLRRLRATAQTGENGHPV